tara:strand:+ start:4205 stop:5113 length:909 start_codon:yes stop_codon:yes gene_type:complete
MKKIYLIILTFSTLFIILSCADERKEEQKVADTKEVVNKHGNSDNLNISFLLDLSDRIDPKKYPNESMQFYLRDAAYIKSVSEAFDTHLRTKKVRQMNDKMQVYFDPEPQNQNINAISNDLRYSVTRENASLNLLDKIKTTYASEPLKIYELAIKDDNYVGSNTWKFFKTKVKDFCIEENYRNILIILTDGYIYHKDTKMKEGNLTSYLTPQDIRGYSLNDKSWRSNIEEKDIGFIPATEELENLEILVLGINPDPKNPYEEEVIRKFWSDWFDKMEVGRYDMKTAGLPSNMDKIIKDFILN